MNYHMIERIITLFASGLLLFTSCAKPMQVYPPLDKGGFDINDVRVSRIKALSGDVSSIYYLQVWAMDDLDNLVPGKKETIEFWNGKLDLAMQKRGIHNYCGPNAGIYEGREARELVKP